MNRRLLVGVLFLFVFFHCRSLNAYILPTYGINDSDMNVPAEDVLAAYSAELGKLISSSRRGIFDEHRRNSKIRLTEAERDQVARHGNLIVAKEFWNYVVNLKKSLLKISAPQPSPDVPVEADLMSKVIIDKLYKISGEYGIKVSALFHNFLINSGIEKKGHCYHYVMDLKRELAKHTWRQFDMHWGTANEGVFSENNALVITARGRPFAEGIAIDAWRSAGKPFWKPVKEDSYPWVEVPNLDYD